MLSPTHWCLKERPAHINIQSSARLSLLTFTCAVVCLLPQAYSNKLRLAALGLPVFHFLWCLGAQRKGMVINMNHLQSVTLGVTQRCNLRCIWCFQDSSPNAELAATETPIEEIYKIIDLIAPYTNRITLTGGEPFIRPDVREVFDHCIKQQNLSVSVTTNSLLISEEMMEYLAENHVGVIVSIDGLAEKHDKIRGVGTFNTTIKKVRQMKALGINVALQMTVSKYNIDDLAKVINMAEELDVFFAIQRMIPFGRGAKFSAWTLLPEDIQRAQETIKNSTYKRVHSKEVLHRPGTDSVVDFMQRYPDCVIGGCKVGMGYAYVDSSGTVYGCPFLPYKLGNVLSGKSIIEILETSNVINNIRNPQKYTGKCRDCRWWHACRGCRATANVYGDFMGDDPLCWYEP